MFWARQLVAVGGSLGFCIAGVAAQVPSVSPIPSEWTLEQLAGRLVLPGVDARFVRDDDVAWAQLEDQARHGLLGGVVLFGGDPLGALDVVQRLRGVSPLPLLVAADFEWGTAMRLDGGTRFPRALALAASRDAGAAEQSVRRLAEVTALEARALGVDLVLAPVADVWTEPRNPVLHDRSFGSDAQRVGDLAVAYVDALQELGVAAAVKHFPGHGATTVDSHVGLPLVALSRAELEPHLAPFQRAVAAGARAVMVGHLAVPALDGEDGRPVSRSRDVVDGLLRRDYGFAGLVVSDALDMGGAGGVPASVAAVESVRAGVDLLLKPSDPAVVRAALVGAVRRGELSREVLEAAARRALRVVRDRAAAGDTEGLRRVWRQADAESAAAAARAITLLEVRDGVLPLPSRHPPLLEVCEVTAVQCEAPGRPFSPLLAALGRRAELARGDGSSGANGERVVSLVLVRAQGGAPLRRAIEARRAEGREVVVIGFGNPHALEDGSSASAVVAAYDSSDVVQRAVGAALFGEQTIDGALPVDVGGWARGTGQTVAAAGELRESAPEEVGMSSAGLLEARQLLARGIEQRVSPGAALVVGRRGRIVAAAAMGRHAYDPEAPEVTLESTYDLASLTKVIVTTTLAMQFVQEGRLELERPVADYLPGFVAHAPNPHEAQLRRSVLVEDLLAHSSGVLWWTDLYRRVGELPPGEARRLALLEIFRTPLETPPGAATRYSDLGILLLGEILVREGGAGLDDLARRRIFEPLGMRSATFSPSARPELSPPTEADPWRGRLLQGEVHDENAAALGGVAPHAGLFANALDLAVFCQMLLQGGHYDGARIVSGAVLERFVRRRDKVPGSSRALGWDTPSSPSSGGRFVSERAFGHTGFTGTSLWIDPERELFVVLLTNRVHPTRENRAHIALRSALHDAILQSITDEDVRPRP